jgi:hypothetical protein
LVNRIISKLHYTVLHSRVWKAKEILLEFVNSCFSMVLTWARRMLYVLTHSFYVLALPLPILLADTKIIYSFVTISAATLLFIWQRWRGTGWSSESSLLTASLMTSLLRKIWYARVILQSSIVNSGVIVQ